MTGHLLRRVSDLTTERDEKIVELARMRRLADDLQRQAVHSNDAHMGIIRASLNLSHDFDEMDLPGVADAIRLMLTTYNHGEVDFTTRRVLIEVADEFKKLSARWGPDLQPLSSEHWCGLIEWVGRDSLHEWAEEVKDEGKDLRHELVELAAAVVKWIEAIDQKALQEKNQA